MQDRSPKWQSSRLRDLPIQIVDGDRSAKYPKRSEFVADGILFLNTTNIIDDRLDLTDANYISYAKFAEIRKGRLQRDDIVMTTRGSIGKVALFNGNHATGLINAQMLILRADGSTIDPRYLFHVVRSSHFQELIRGFSSGSAQPQIPIQDLKEIAISFPDPPTQRRIASILSAYDDLIENNTRRIAILEEMTQSLYREWFVHFRYPGHEHVTLVDSPLGPVPDGWDVVPLTELIELNPKVRVPKDGDKPFVPMGSLSTSSMLIEDIECRAGNSGAKFQNGDTLFARITPCLENGKTGFVKFLPTVDAVACGSTEFIVMRSLAVCPEYVYLLAREDRFRDHAIKSMTGATGRQRVQDSSLRQFQVANPTQEAIKCFKAAVSPMFEMIYTLARKNANLRRTRDLLLPKLIGGDIDSSQEPLSMEVT